MKHQLDIESEIRAWERKLLSHREKHAASPEPSSERLDLHREIRTIEEHLERLRSFAR